MNIYKRKTFHHKTSHQKSAKLSKFNWTNKNRCSQSKLNYSDSAKYSRTPYTVHIFNVLHIFKLKVSTRFCGCAHTASQHCKWIWIEMKREKKMSAWMQFVVCLQLTSLQPIHCCSQFTKRFCSVAVISVFIQMVLMIRHSAFGIRIIKSTKKSYCIVFLYTVMLLTM